MEAGAEELVSIEYEYSPYGLCVGTVHVWEETYKYVVDVRDREACEKYTQMVTDAFTVLEGFFDEVNRVSIEKRIWVSGLVSGWRVSVTWTQASDATAIVVTASREAAINIAVKLGKTLAGVPGLQFALLDNRMKIHLPRDSKSFRALKAVLRFVGAQAYQQPLPEAIVILALAEKAGAPLDIDYSSYYELYAQEVVKADSLTEAVKSLALRGAIQLLHDDVYVYGVPTGKLVQLLHPKSNVHASIIYRLVKALIELNIITPGELSPALLRDIVRATNGEIIYDDLWKRIPRHLKAEAVDPLTRMTIYEAALKEPNLVDNDTLQLIRQHALIRYMFTDKFNRNADIILRRLFTRGKAIVRNGVFYWLAHTGTLVGEDDPVFVIETPTMITIKIQAETFEEAVELVMRIYNLLLLKQSQHELVIAHP